MLEILANIGMSMVIFLRGTPEDEKIEKNIELLQRVAWFRELYSENEEEFRKDPDLRYLIGTANVEKCLESEKRSEQLRRRVEKYKIVG
ncbi:hypothetical protein [Halalkalibacter krulwichiae]|uniref:Uncharacterized protein n=1 Tax=Halalkalibacter krulwichiae TaxID=199441 RepID=A0A1X9MGC6_9BACI|nr:hypothetical protein [Halalkalibacter krulwichiae]ARK32498.1 hypothetical protein BkAM31D_22985 [Halalkalibacter krulwichiae]